jgi:TRAP-type mannitol/chloroaromatic compound transport system permease small subunit
MGLMGAGYTQLHKGHIAVDVIINLLPPKIKIVIELIVNFIFLFSLIILLHQVGKMTFSSIHELERSSSYWSPPIYPLKIIILIGVFLLFLQCLVQFFDKIRECANLKNLTANHTSVREKGVGREP